VPPKSYQMLDLNRFANYLLEKQSHIRNQSRIRLERKMDRNRGALELKSPYGKFSLPSGRLRMSNFHDNVGKRNEGCKNLWAQKSWLQCADSPPLAVSSIGSLGHEEFERLCSPDTNSIIFSGKEPDQSDEQIGTSASKSEVSDSSELNYDRLPHNWFYSSCLEKASEVFTKRLL